MSNIVILWGKIHFLQGRYEIVHRYIHFSTCELTILPRTLEKYQDFLTFSCGTCCQERQLHTPWQCIKAGQTELMTKMSRPHSWKTSKNVFNFTICYHIRKSKGLAIYYLLHPSCPFTYVLSSPTLSPIQTRWLSSTLIAFVIIIVIITLFFFIFTFSVSFTG